MKIKFLSSIYVIHIGIFLNLFLLLATNNIQSLVCGESNPHSLIIQIITYSLYWLSYPRPPQIMPGYSLIHLPLGKWWLVHSHIEILCCSQIAGREHLNQLAKGCSLGDMLSFDDTDRDGRLNINEFYMAFSKLYSKLLHLLQLINFNLA